MVVPPKRFVAFAVAAYCTLGMAPAPVPSVPMAPVPADVRRPGPQATDNGTAGSWTWPLTGQRAILKPFEAPATRYSAGHRGVDLPAVGGAVVVAPTSGVVSFTGSVVDRPVLSIMIPGGLVASVEPVLASVSEGESVTAGDEVGVVADGGHCSGSCIHFGVRLHGEYVNPLALLETLPRSVLLPLGR